MKSFNDKKNIDIFFMDPALNPAPQNKSSLYILRLDLSNCIEPKDANSHKVIWGSSSIILSGIDLLGQYYSGNTNNLTRGVEQRFTDFCTRYITEGDDHKSQILYQLRNAFLHNYGLVSFSPSDGTKAFIFEVDFDYTDSWFIEHKPKPDFHNYYRINLYNLYTKFNDAIISYKDDVYENKDGLFDKFNSLLNIYGFIGLPKERSSVNSGSSLTSAM